MTTVTWPGQLSGAGVRQGELWSLSGGRAWGGVGDGGGQGSRHLRETGVRGQAVCIEGSAKGLGFARTT